MYFFLSPLFFYIHVLFELSRAEWRNATTWSGSYCERVVKNLLREYDRCFATNNYDIIADKKFNIKLGRLRSILEEKKFEASNELCNLLEIVYDLRSTKGPHDVPPPEPLRAQISANQCLPVYIAYLEILTIMKNNLSPNFNTFVTFFGELTEFKITLIFGSDNNRLTVEQVVKNILYREGFFNGAGKKLSEVQTQIQKNGYNFTKQAINNILLKLSKGKEAVLTKKGKKGNYIYYERYPPQDIFKTTI